MHADNANGSAAEGEDHEPSEGGESADNDTQPDTWSNGEHIAGGLSTEEVATAVEQPEIKIPRQQRLWDAPSKAREADEVVMLEGTASEVATEETRQPVEAPAAASKESAPAQAPRRRHETGSSEPRIERVVVRPGDESSGSDGEAQAAPQRKGWWQRKFSGE
jgi:ribonuclease E